MTVSSTTSRVDYVGSGITGPYSFPFRIQAAADLTVIARNLTTGLETTYSYPGDYSFSTGAIGARNGGSITLTSVLAAGNALALIRSPALTQLTNLRNQGRYFPSDVEDALDRGVMIAQELGDDITHALRIPSSVDPTVFDPTLPGNLTAGNAVVVNATGTGFSMSSLSAATLSAWNAAHNMQLDTFVSPTNFTAGVTTQLTLSGSPGSLSNLRVTRRTGGVVFVYESDEYSITGTTLTFSVAIPVGTTRVEVSYLFTYQVNTADAANVIFVQAGTGAVTRDVRAKVREQSFSVRDFGAVGDGVTDDTTNVQRAATAAGAAGGKLHFPATAANTYVVRTITIVPGTTVESDLGVVITRPATRPNGERIFTCATYSSNSDSLPVVFRNLIVDGNRANQGAYSAYQLQQSHCIYVAGDATKTGRVNAVFDNVIVRENVADGISIANNVVAQLVNCRGVNCFRGSVTIQGGTAEVAIANLQITNTDTICVFGFHVELDTPGYAGSLALQLLMVNAQIDAPWSFQAGAGSQIRLVNAQGGTGTVAAPSTILGSLLGVTFEAVNCRFDFGVTSAFINRIVDPTNATFTGCEFRVNRQGAPGGAQDFQAADIYWEVLDTTGLRRCRFKACQFTTTGLIGGDTATAVFTQASLLAHDNQLILDGCEIEAGYTTGLRITQGGVFRVRGLRNNAVTPFYVSCSGGGYDFDGKLDSVELGPLATSYMNMVSNQVGSTLEHENVTVDEAKNVIATSFGVVSNVYRGRRVILGAAAPGAGVSAFLGDIWRLKTPVAGSIFEYVCTLSSATAATWQPLTIAGVSAMPAIVSINANTPLVNSNPRVIVKGTATPNPLVLTLPFSYLAPVGSRVTLQKVDAGANNCRIDPAGTETIDGVAAGVLLKAATKGTSITVELATIDPAGLAGDWRTVAERVV
jgi:hypothetical protein